MCLKIGLLHSLSEPGFTDFSANSGRPERVRLPVLPLSGHVGVGFLLHAGCALFAVGMRREHLLHGGGFGAFRQFDQLIERVGHAVGVEPVFLVSPSLAGVFFITEPPGKPLVIT